MIKVRNLAAVLVISSAAALPACSMLGDSNSSHASYASPQSPALSQTTIRQVQTNLQQAGDYNGNIDGLWGPATENGVRSYQQQHNLNASGQLDGNTLTALNLVGTSQPTASAEPNANAQPGSQNVGTNNVPPANANAPSSVATQPNTSTTK